MEYYNDRASEAISRHLHNSGKHISFEQVEDPFYVLIHLSELNDNYWKTNFPGTVARTFWEIETIKERFPHLIHEAWPPETILLGTPRDKIILVCGCYYHDCVDRQTRALRQSGRKAYISHEGTPSLFLMD